MKGQNVSVCPDDIFKTAKHFVTKLDIVMHHQPECHAKRLVCCFQGQGHSKGSYDQNMTVSIISFATKHGLIVHYHKPKCLIGKSDFCVQGQGHSKILK